MLNGLGRRQVVPTGVRKGIVPYRLSSITKPLERPVSERMAIQAMHRILAADGVSYFFYDDKTMGTRITLKSTMRRRPAFFYLLFPVCAIGFDKCFVL